uniref:PHD-type domain-containing protein n=1 Tax=Falco tinnunculus TaxID=100819 RepID=A0A8C4V813_FALTI
MFCRQKIKKISGACIQCSYGRCPASFHVTCAHAAGVLMEPDDWPYVVYITCFRAKACEKTITVGQTVITKHKNTRYYSCRVIGVTSQLFYEVMFDDGSFSLDTFPEDIVVKSVFLFKWPDGKLYSAKYLGTNTAHMYQVEFEDGSEIVMKREEIYTLDEELPKRVKEYFTVVNKKFPLEESFSEALKGSTVYSMFFITAGRWAHTQYLFTHPLCDIN